MISRMPLSLWGVTPRSLLQLSTVTLHVAWCVFWIASLPLLFQKRCVLSLMTDDFSNKESILHDKGNVRNLEQLKFPYTNSRIFRGKKKLCANRIRAVIVNNFAPSNCHLQPVSWVLFVVIFTLFFWDEALSDVDLNKNITDQVRNSQFSIGFDSVAEMRLVWLYLNRSQVSYFLCRYCNFRFVAIGYLALCTVR